MKLGEKHVLLTGGSKGIGAVIASRLRAEGARLTLVARPSVELTATAAAVGAATIEADLGDFDRLASIGREAVERNGEVDVLINNAALSVSGKLTELTTESLRQQITANLMAPMELARQLLPGMIERNRGAVVNVSSLAGEVSLPHLPCYGASKAGLTKWSLDLQRELARTAVDAQVFLLGSVPGTQLALEGTKDPVVAHLEKRFLIMPALKPEAVADGLAESLEKGGSRVVTLPRFAAPLMAIRLAPIRLADLVFRGAPL